MVQRIQSLYLSLTTLMSLLLLNGSFLNFADKSGSVIKITFKGIFREAGGQGFELIEKLLPLSAIIILIAAISLASIFIFRNRKIQSWLALSVIVLVTGLMIISILYSNFVITEFGAEIIPGFKMVIPLLMLIFAVLAYRGIKNDDRLVKSYDRLR